MADETPSITGDGFRSGPEQSSTDSKCTEKPHNEVQSENAGEDKANDVSDEDSELGIDLDEWLDNIKDECNEYEKMLFTGIIKPSDVHTTFKDVHVEPATVESLRTLTSLSLLRPDSFEYGILKSNEILGVLLYGPPGTGKTHLAKAVAKESGATMLEISGADVFQQYIGESEKVVRAVFSLARKLDPCVIFFDEADAVFRARSDDEKGYHREILNQFLKEWDSITGSGFMMVATNRPYDLDDAVLRRLPHRILVDVPTVEDREAILRIQLKDEDLASDVDIKALSMSTPNYSGSDLKHLCVSAAYTCVREEVMSANRMPSGLSVPRRLRAKITKKKYAAKRTLCARHFDKALADVPGTIDMMSLSKIRSFQKRGPQPKKLVRGPFALSDSMDNKQLCELCCGLNFDTLTQTAGYRHAATVRELHKSAKSCPMCKLIEDSLISDAKETDNHLPKEGIVCRFRRPEQGKAVVEVMSASRRGYIHVYTYGDADPASGEVQVNHKPNSATMASITFPLAMAMIGTCMQDHKCADPFRHPITGSKQVVHSNQHPELESELDLLPSRLIFLDAFGKDESADARLVEVRMNFKNPGEQGFYAALSYCWGPDSGSMYKTELATLDARKERISWTDLPKTFQDAFRITRRLGIPFLWIDAICITQDSGDDWWRESAKMGGIYATASVTIAADVSDSVAGGILDLETGGDEEQAGCIRISSMLKSGQKSSLTFYQRYSKLPGATWTPQAIIDSPLTMRAWCMQERMLSSRTLHFTKQGIIWECRESYFSFARCATFLEISDVNTFASIPHRLQRGLPKSWRLRMPPLEESSTNPADLTSEQLTLINSIWRTGQQISRISVAIQHDGEVDGDTNQSQLVSWWNRSVITPYSERRVTYTTDRLLAISGIAMLFAKHIQAPYVAGLWLTKLDGTLDWTRAGETFQDNKLNFPSFSWVSHPGPICWTYEIDMRPFGPAFDILGHHVRFAGSDPHGNITAAELTLCGHICGVSLGKIEKETGKIKSQLLDKGADEIGMAELDFELDHVDSTGGLYGFLLYKNSVGFLRLLLLVQTRDVYKRIGVGMIQPGQARWLEETEKRLIRLT